MSDVSERWHRPSEIDVLREPEEAEGLRETLRWVREFLARPHEDLGRGGPVCPFIPAALERESLYFRIADTDSREGIEQAVSIALADFGRLEPKTMPEARFKALIVLFPAVTADTAPDLIDKVQAEKKPEFVKQALMIGQFHRANDTPGNHNRRFRPLQSPIPLLAVRVMVVEDLPFLTGGDIPAERQLEYLGAYLDNLATWPASSSRDARVKEVVKILGDLVRSITTGE